MFSQLLATFCLALLVPSSSAAATSNLRGADLESPVVVRHLNDFDVSVLCRVVTFGTMFFDATSQSSSTEDLTVCLPIVDDVELELEFPIDLPDDITEQYEQEIHGGTLMVSISDAIISEKKLVLGLQPQFTVITNTTRYRHLLERHLQVKPEMTVAVVRVSTTDSSPRNTARQLRTNLFDSNGINFVTQYKAISFGKLQWSLAPAGVIEVKVPQSISSFSSYLDLVEAAQDLAKAKLKVSEITSIADKVLFCLPPGTGNWAASAGVNHWRAQFNNDWCTSLSGTMHELGHTMGLLHARANGVDYADRSGYMGSGYTDETYPQKAFNGYNNWQFGWYSDKDVTLFPLQVGNRLVKIASFVDYELAAKGEFVLVNISNKYFLQYNTDIGFNIDTEQKQNQVTVTEALSTGTDSRAGISVGGTRFTVSNFLSSGKTLIVEACKTMQGSNGAFIMQVSIGIGKSLCA
jgi:hypothetical protein